MSSDQSDTDTVVIDRDDVSNYNPEQILPETPETILKLRAWLKPTSYDLESGEYRKHLASHAAGTGEWLTSSDLYNDWLQGKENGLFWIKGIPGSGKSVLASKIVRELSLNHPGTPVLYFFFRQIIDANHEPMALLRDWLDQILAYSPPLQKQLKDYVVEKGRSLNSMSMEDMWKNLRLAFSGLHGKVFCVADALDEMDRGNEKFLQGLAELGNWKPHKVKVLITSRPVPIVEIPLRTAKYSQMRLQENMVDIDISTYVQRSLKTSAISPENQQLIQEAIPGRANGLFLYAKLAMDAFLEPGADIKEVLKLLPDDMNAMYADLLHEHSRRSEVPDDIQLLILQWVTHATRPLRLLEMAEMINVTYPGDTARDLKATKDLVRAACGPLLEILPDETVCVIHHSFTEYLKGSTRSADDTGYTVLQQGPTHASLGLACLRYMQAVYLDEIKAKSESGSHSQNEYHNKRGDSENVSLKLMYPFFDYAASNWHVHMSRSAATGHDQTEIIQALDGFLEDPHRLEAWIKIRWPGGGHAEKVTPLHVAAKCGLAEWAKHLISSTGISVDAADDAGKTPLFWAASSGWADVVRVLIDCGANPDQDETYSGLKPLHEACDNNHPEVIKVLLEAGVDPLTKKTLENPGNWCGNAPRSVGKTPLMYACHNGHLESVEAFLPFLKDPETIHRALAWSCEAGRHKIVARLLQLPGVDINRKIRGGTPLFRACQANNLELITLLLNKGASPSIRCQEDQEFGGCNAPRYNEYYGNSDEDEATRGTTALYMVCDCTRRRDSSLGGDSTDLNAVLDLFIEKGADVHERTRRGATLIHAAVNHPVWIRLLLDHGVDPNLASDDGCTPLHDVKSAESMALLIEHGKADINKRSSKGMTPLHHLVGGYHSDLALKFLEYGPDCNITNNDGNGALHVALQSTWADPKVIAALLEAGADPNLRNKSGQTPLDVINMNNRSSIDVMDILLKAGADINAKDRDGATILFRTVYARVVGNAPHEDIKALLDRGAEKDTRDFKGRTLLHEAIKSTIGVRLDYGSIPRFDFLLSLNLDPQAVDYQGNNLFHELSWHYSNHESNSGEIMPIWEQLLELGLDVDKANHRGRTPLHNLCGKIFGTRGFKHGKGPIDLVISRAKNIDAADKDGITPLHMAATTSEYYTKKLLDAGADPRIPTCEGLTPLHLAARTRQSNIVGMLLDALHKLGGGESARGNWLADEHADPVPGVDVKDSTHRTPLHYACTSGRPEVVSMLLKAGASAKVKNLRDAITEFELELDVWKTGTLRRDVSHDAENGNAAGLTPRDPTRPYNRNSSGTNIKPFHDTARLEEIIEMLLDHGADLSESKDEWMYSRHYGKQDTGGLEMGQTELGCRDYTAKCLTDARLRRGLKGPAISPGKTGGTFDEHLVNYRREATVKALREYKGIGKGEANATLFISRLKRREYEAVEELFHLGVDFLARHDEYGSTNHTNLRVLIEGGFTSLFDRIGWFEAERKHEQGMWHAAGDEKRPGFGDNTAFIGPAKEVDGFKPFLLQAVDQELPVFDLVRLLVEKFGVNVNEGSHGSALHELAKGYHWWHVAQALPYLISRGANIDMRNDGGQTPLHVALDAGGSPYNYNGPFHCEAARLLVLSGADVNATDDNGVTCLAYAGSDAEMIRLLIENGATIKPDALFTAINRHEVDVVEALLSAGTSPNLRFEENPVEPYKLDSTGHVLHSWSRSDVPDSGWYPLHHVAANFYHPWREERQKNWSAVVKMAKLLLTHGADPLAKFTRCTTKECFHQLDETKPIKWRSLVDSDDPKPRVGEPNPLLGAEHHEECVVLHQLLVDGHLVHPLLKLPGIDPNYRDGRGRTVFLAACFSKRGPDKPLSLLLDEKADENGKPAPTLFEHMLALGADSEARDADGRNALHHLLRFRHERNSPRPAILKSLTHMVENHPSLINQQDKQGKTPLYLAVDRAVYEKETTLADLLLAHGADPLITDNEGNTVLHSLCRMLWVSTLRPLFENLVRHGCDVNARNSRGETPLFGYVGGFFGNMEDLDLYSTYRDVKTYDEAGALAALEAADADFGVRDGGGRGLLHYAAKGHHVRFKVLMDRGLDPMLEDNDRKTALDVAAACGNAGVLKLFKRGDAPDDDESESDDDLDSVFGF